MTMSLIFHFQIFSDILSLIDLLLFAGVFKINLRKVSAFFTLSQWQALLTRFEKST